LVNWYLGIWRGEPAPLGRVPKAAERFEAAQWLSDRGWGGPPQYVDLALAATEVKRIEVTFEAIPRVGNSSGSSVVADVTPVPHDGEANGPSVSVARPGLPAPRSYDGDHDL
jgi:hypothetical protein